jgi:phenylacetate-CoA ligase
MGDHFDLLEVRDPEIRERELLAQLPRQIAHAKSNASRIHPHPRRRRGCGDHLARCARASAGDAQSSLLDLQKNARPFGGLAAAGWGEAARVFASPGPSTSPKAAAPITGGSRGHCSPRAFVAAISSTTAFSYHFTPAGSMLETGAHALGCTVFPAGIGQTEQQVQAMSELKPAGYVGTPSFLRIILEKADEMGVALPSLKKALVSAEAFPKSFCDALLARGIAGFQAYATADLGTIAYETEAREGLVIDEGVLVEIVRPGTGDPVAEGEVGEVVVTSLFNTDYPLIRFGTGDLSAVLPGASPCGRTNVRIKGWMGRADQTTKVKGLFVHPSQVAAIIARHPEIAKARLVVDNPEGVGPDDAQRRDSRQQVVESPRPSSRRSATSRSCAVKSRFTRRAHCRTMAR